MQQTTNSHGDLISLSGPQNWLMKPIEEPDLSTIGGRVRARRLSLGMDQVELAEAVGIKQPSLSAIETNDVKEITARVMGGLCTSLALSWEYLMYGRADMSESFAAAQSELLAIFRGLPDAATRNSLLHSARTLRDGLAASASVSHDESAQQKPAKIGLELKRAFRAGGGSEVGRTRRVQKPKNSRGTK